MPDDLNDSAFLQTADAAAESSARAQRAQAEFAERGSATSPSASLKPSVNLDESNSDFDKLVDSVVQDPNNPANALSDAPASKPKGETKPDEAPAKPAEEAAPEATPAKKGPLDDLLKQATAKPDEAPPAKPEDPYADHQLPATASVKARENFDRLKATAAADIKAAADERDAAVQRAKEFEAKLNEAQQTAGKLTPELEQELKELREHRALFDTERDPQFRQKFDSRIDRNYQGIYSELHRHGLPSAEIDKLKAFPKADRDRAIEGFLDKLEPADRRIIESKLVSNLGIEEERNTELSRVRTEAEQHIKSQREAPQQAAQQRADTIANLVGPQLKGLDWIYTKDIPAGTPPEVRKALEQHNELAAEMQSDLRSAITNDDPETRATAALSVPLAKWFARENAALKAQLKELSGKLERYSSASRTSRLAERASVKSDTPKPALDLNQEGGDAVDNLFKTAQEK